MEGHEAILTKRLSIMQKLELLFIQIGRENGFEAKASDKGLWLRSRTGKFSAKAVAMVISIANNYDVNVRVDGQLIISKPGRCVSRRSK